MRPFFIRHKNRTDRLATFGHTDTPKEWAEKRENYYHQWFGEAKLVSHEMIPFVPHVDIYIYPPSAALNRPFVTLVTSGMSDIPMFLPSGVNPKYARAEILMYVEEDNSQLYTAEEEWYVSVMRYLAHFPFENKTWFAHSHTLQNGTPPIPWVEGSELTTALFLPPLWEHPSFASGLQLDGESVNFLCLTLITDDECDYKIRHGLEGLGAIFERVGYPQTVHKDRKSILK